MNENDKKKETPSIIGSFIPPHLTDLSIDKDPIERDLTHLWYIVRSSKECRRIIESIRTNYRLKLTGGRKAWEQALAATEELEDEPEETEHFIPKGWNPE